MQQKSFNQKSEIQEYNATVPLVQTLSLPPTARPPLLRPLAWRILVTFLALIGLTVLGLLAGTSWLEAATLAKPPGRAGAAPFALPFTMPNLMPNLMPNSAVHAAPRAAPNAFGAGDRLVMAFYYSWFDENTWTYDKLSDMPSEQYVSRDRGIMGRHIDQAQGAGIDAFLVAWYGPAGGTNQTEPNLAAMLDEAAARGFKIGILFETDGPFFSGVGDVTTALQHAQNTHFNHPAYLKVDGRPVVYFWRPTTYGVDTWRNVRSQSDPSYTNIWISEGVNTAYLDVFDGHHLYSNTWNPPADLHGVNRRYANEVAAARDRLGSYKFWVATVMPGYNDVKIRAGAGGFAQDRQGGAYYTRSWDAAIASNPNWIVINSFNEWPEGSYIESSAAHGNHYMNLTGQYSGQFKAGGGLNVALTVPVPAEPAPTPTPTPEPTSPTAFVNVAALNLRAGPGVDFPILTQVTQGAALPITGRHPAAAEWWQVESGGAGGSETGWVHREFVTSGGPMDQVGILADAALPQLAVAAFEQATNPVPQATDADPTTEATDLTDLAARAASLTLPAETGTPENGADPAEPELATLSRAIAPLPDTGQTAAQSISSTVSSTTSATVIEAGATGAGANPAFMPDAMPIPNPTQFSLHPYLSR
ncbi:MAG: endo-1,3-alpha-glucanase family glycosylhydrolase [Litorilinea sp.]